MAQKKIHRFFVDTLSPEKTISVSEERLVHQLKHVLRYTRGETCILFTDGGPDELVRIVAIEKDRIDFERIQTVENSTRSTRTVIAAVSIIKKDLFELVVQKLTELGISEIVPIISDRTIKQSLRLDRLELIALEALEQCGGNKKVLIHEPTSLSACLETFSYPSYVCIPGEPTELKTIPEKVVFYIGPEGGWTNDEEVLFETKSATPLSLGPRILRAETATIVTASKLTQ